MVEARLSDHTRAQSEHREREREDGGEIRERERGGAERRSYSCSARFFLERRNEETMGFFVHHGLIGRRCLGRINYAR